MEFKKAHPKFTPIQLDLDWKKSLLLDLDVVPTPLFVRDDLPKDPEAAPEDPPPEHEEGEDYIKIEW